jgi:trehalose-phosphatase
VQEPANIGRNLVNMLITNSQSIILSSSSKLLVVDFDGTLSEIVDRPELATLDRGTWQHLSQLAQRPDFIIAICSGRSIADVRQIVNIEHVVYAGNHGLEIAGRGLHFLAPSVPGVSQNLALITSELKHVFAKIQGVQIEEKGLSVAVHYRRAKDADPTAIEADVRRIIRDRSGFIIRHGKMVFDVRPDVAWNKGNAALWIRDQMGCEDSLPIVIGDDLSDEDMFAEFSDGLTIRVGLDGQTCAKHRLHDPREVAQFLAWLASAPMPCN